MPAQQPRHRKDDRDADTREYAVTSTEPVTLTSPRRTVRTVAVAYAAAIIICSAAAAWIATVTAHERAAALTDRRMAVLERDLQQRRSAAAEANARRDQQLAELRRLVCIIVDRLQPRDAAVEAVRTQFQCDAPLPGPPTGTAPSPTPTPTATRRRGSADGSQRAPPTGTTTATPAPRSPPQPAPSATKPPPPPSQPPPPDDDDDLPLLCLPLIGCVL